MKIAALFASWEKFGEAWNTPRSIMNELESRGHEIAHYNLYHNDGQPFPDKMRHYSNQGINQLHADCRQGYRPDVVFCMDYGPWDAVAFDYRVFPGSIVIKELGDLPQSYACHLPCMPRIHIGLSPDFPCTQDLINRGFNAVWWTHFADERIFHPRNTEPVYDCVTTCGGRKYTAEIQNALGNRFNNERYFYGEEHAKRLCMGKIVLQSSQFQEITRRVFEGMACGRLMLTDRLPEYRQLHTLFKDGEDIIFYDNAKDAIDKIKYFASHDQEREAIALNGYNKVMENHTVAKRVDTFLACVQAAKETLL